MKNKMIIYQVLPRLFGNQNDAVTRQRTDAGTSLILPKKH